jgi:hypothetical protein
MSPRCNNTVIVVIIANSAEEAESKARSLPGFTVVSQRKAGWGEKAWCIAGIAEKPIDTRSHVGDSYVLSLDIDYDQDVTASDYVFIPWQDEENWLFAIVRSSFWFATEKVNDNDSKIDDLMPQGFGNSMEGIYEYYRGGVEDARKALVQAGFREVTPPPGFAS